MMDPQFTAMLATQHHLDLLAEASRQRIAASARRRLSRARLGDGLVRLGRHLAPATETGAAPVPQPRAAARQPCTAC